MGGSFEYFQDMEKASFPPWLWMSCGKVLQILSTGGKGSGATRQPYIRSEAEVVIPDMAVLRFSPHYPQPLRLILNPKSYLIKCLN